MVFYGTAAACKPRPGCTSSATSSPIIRASASRTVLGLSKNEGSNQEEKVKSYGRIVGKSGKSLVCLSFFYLFWVTLKKTDHSLSDAINVVNPGSHKPSPTFTIFMGAIMCCFPYNKPSPDGSFMASLWHWLSQGGSHFLGLIIHN